MSAEHIAQIKSALPHLSEETIRKELELTGSADKALDNLLQRASPAKGKKRAQCEPGGFDTRQAKVRAQQANTAELLNGGDDDEEEDDEEDDGGDGEEGSEDDNEEDNGEDNKLGDDEVEINSDDEADLEDELKGLQDDLENDPVDPDAHQGKRQRK
eukprot:c28365_g1_i1.p1 GENE.c28365_g1_i1~~c28365_g1_i1.p1  ORF type:complete len:168 (+),score=48.43 c28365_g1_i1:35-505(+)